MKFSFLIFLKGHLQQIGWKWWQLVFYYQEWTEKNKPEQVDLKKSHAQRWALYVLQRLFVLFCILLFDMSYNF